MEVSQMLPTIKLEGEIVSNSQGINRILKYYSDASKYRNTDIIVDCYDLEWIDANLAALLHAIDHRLLHENGVRVKADFTFLSQKFGVLFKNGWLQDDSIKIEDTHNTTIPCLCFKPTEDLAFCEYINRKLLCHKGVNIIDDNLRRRILTDMAEIFNNTSRHARTTDPLFVCGQYYPHLNNFVFTMVDLGIGFLPPIQEFTAGKIQTDIDAIRWALEGNSSTGEQLAGMGLQGIHSYCKNHNAGLQIVTGGSFWGTDIENTIWEGHRTLDHRFQGTLINLCFAYKP